MYIPWFGPLGGNAANGFVGEGWHITHDFKGWDNMRDIKPKYGEWIEYQAWRSNGMVAKHPTASMVLYNQKAKNLCFQQGRYVLNTSNLDAATTVQEIRDAPPDSDLKGLMSKIIEVAHIRTSNGQHSRSLRRLPTGNHTYTGEN